MALGNIDNKKIENLRAQDKTIFFVFQIRANTVEILWASVKGEYTAKVFRPQIRDIKKIKVLRAQAKRDK